MASDIYGYAGTIDRTTTLTLLVPQTNLREPTDQYHLLSGPPGQPVTHPYNKLPVTIRIGRGRKLQPNSRPSSNLDAFEIKVEKKLGPWHLNQCTRFPLGYLLCRDEASIRIHMNLARGQDSLEPCKHLLLC